MPAEVILLLAALILTAGSAGLLIVRLTNPRLKGLGFLGAAFAIGGAGAGMLFSVPLHTAFRSPRPRRHGGGRRLRPPPCGRP